MDTEKANIGHKAFGKQKPARMTRRRMRNGSSRGNRERQSDLPSEGASGSAFPDSSPEDNEEEPSNSRLAKWGGKMVKKVQGDTYFSAVRLGDEVFAVGDCVTILVQEQVRNAKNNRTRMITRNSVACIESMWEDRYKEKWLEARWFFEPRETRFGKRARKGVFGEHELFESDSTTDCTLDALDYKVQVVSYENYLQLKKQGASQNCDENDDLFYCKHFYNADLGILRNVDWSTNRRPGLYSKRLPEDGGAISTSVSREYPPKKKQRRQENSDPTGIANGPLRSRDEMFGEASNMLQLSAVPPSLPCREMERGKIMDFLEGAISRGGLGCALYVSGMPGTGKTATVLEVVRSLQRKHEQGLLPSFQFVEINGMKLPHPYQAYTLLYKALTGQTVAQARAAQLLEQRFSTPSSRRPVCVVLVDELDYMVTRKQTVLYNLFDWPTRRHARLVVVGIANTMDLPERLLPRIHSRLGMGRVVFPPYTREQIEQIVQARLGDLGIFDEDAIQMCSRKVASISGDIRRALQMCRRAAEICNRQNNESCVTMGHINQAARELCESLHIKKIQSAPLCEKLLLIAAYKHAMSTGLEEFPLDAIFHRFKTLCSTYPSDDTGAQVNPTTSDALRLCRRLGACRLLDVHHAPDARTPTVRLGIEADDIKFAFQEQAQFEPLFQS